MSEPDFAVMAMALGVSCLAAAIAARRIGNDKRDVRLMLGSGAALSGVALVLFSLARASQ